MTRSRLELKIAVVALAALALVSFAQGAQAQFSAANILGVSANLTGSDATAMTNDFAIQVDPGAKFAFQSAPSTFFDIVDVFGVFHVYTPQATDPGAVSTTRTPDWAIKNFTGGGVTASGFTNDSKSDSIAPGDTKGTFTFYDEAAKFGYTGNVVWGYHVRWYTDDTHTETATGFISVVPEPAYYQLGGLLLTGGLGAIWRRRRNRAAA